MSLSKSLVRRQEGLVGKILGFVIEKEISLLFQNRPVPLMGSAGVSSNGGLSNGVTGSKGEVNSFFLLLTSSCSTKLIRSL